jgi:hypothetical protein
MTIGAMGVVPQQDQQPGERLSLLEDRGRMRYALQGAFVENGDALQLLLPGGKWLEGVFEWSGMPARWPNLRFAIGGPWEHVHNGEARTCAVALPPDALLRRAR